LQHHYKPLIVSNNLHLAVRGKIFSLRFRYTKLRKNGIQRVARLCSE
jgi:hypothetical protein